LIDTIIPPLALVCIALAGIGCLYAIAAAVAVRRYARQSAARNGTVVAVTVLKPLHGAEPGLYANLRSFCAQDYPAHVEVVFGAQNAGDPALAVVRQVISEFPGRSFEIVMNTDTTAVNGKISNLIAMQSAIHNDVIVISDSDIRVGPDYLRTIVETLSEPGVGLVTCLYRGEADPSVWSRLAAMAIDYHFLPNVLMGLALGLARPCFGSTLALTRRTLQDIGSFAAFADQLADDHAMGAAVRARGMRVALAPVVLAHQCSESSLADLLRHELRWARTIRAIDPAGYAGSVVTHALPLALIAGALRGFDVLGLGAIIGALACRVVLMIQVDHTLGLPSGRWWLAPVRDVLSFAIFVASFFVGVVSWRGQRYIVRRDGTMVEVKGSRS
jgi:ceramide glucosyltransferase